MSVIEELRWRGMLHSATPGAEKELARQGRAVYAGFDPTAPSLQVGNLVPVMLLLHFQRHGHRPIVLVGGATGMIGDPSGKTEERNLQSLDTIRNNVTSFRRQLRQFLDFDDPEVGAVLVDNYEWFKDMRFLAFLRDVGKHLTVNYMIAKDSVRRRMETGLSFTEFSYQLLQAYDFYQLHRDRGCTVQVGGSDQWGNITSGIELIRRMGDGDAHAVTCPLLTQADGSKFGKTASGEALWLDPSMTSPYKFYQYWLNVSDEDAVKLAKTFTLLPREEIEELRRRHEENPHERVLQRALARDITVRVHSEEAYRSAREASEILFGKGTVEALRRLSGDELQSLFDEVPRYEIPRQVVEQGVDVVSMLAEYTAVFSSRGETRRMIAGGGLNINMRRIDEPAARIDTSWLLSGDFVLVRKGKKNYSLLRAV